MGIVGQAAHWKWCSAADGESRYGPLPSLVRPGDVWEQFGLMRPENLPRPHLTMSVDKTRMRPSTLRGSPDNLPEIVGPLIAPLYERFSFFQLPPILVAEELALMRSRRFYYRINTGQSASLDPWDFLNQLIDVRNFSTVSPASDWPSC